MEAIAIAKPSDPLITRYRGYTEQAHSPLPADKGRFGNPYLRFTILFAFLVVAIATFPLWISIVIPQYAQYAIAAITVFFGLQWMIIAVCAVLNYRRLDYVPIPAWEESLALRQRKFKHIVIVPCYLDPLDVLHNCVETLVFQERTEDLVVVVTFEKKTPELEMKIASVRGAFADKFGDFLIVVHELNAAVEIPGGCSNKNFALREAYKYISKRHGTAFHTSRYTVTTCDTDSKFHPRYFEVLQQCYNSENPREDVAVKMCVWQPSLFYNWNLDERPFHNRVTCIMRTMMMLGGLISFNLNPMSIFSYPLELGYMSGFINPRYGVDDIICRVRWMCDTKIAVPVKLLPVIVISGPTIGTTFWEEVNEWGRQCRRWIVGASESFHYFVIHWRGRPFFAGIAWFFTFFNYYGILLCSAGIFQILASIPYPWMEEKTLHFSSDASLLLTYAGPISLGLQMLAFAIGFAIDAVGARRLGLEEDISPLRNLAHWIVSPAVLLVYSLIAFASIVRFVFEGKKMAGHDMAAKAGLAVDRGITVEPIEQRHNEPEAVVKVHDGASMRDSFVSSKAMPSQMYGAQGSFTSSRGIPSGRALPADAASSHSESQSKGHSLNA